MKKSIAFIAGLVLVAIFTVLTTSCDKKTTVAVDNMDATVTMTYSPNPATVNTPIEFNFEVMENMVAVDVTEVTCGMMQGMNTLNSMTMTKTGTGIYMGTTKFDKSDSTKITFNYNHHGTKMMQDFMINVK